MIRAFLHPDGYTVRLDATDAAEYLLDLVAVAFVDDEQLVGEQLRTLATAVAHRSAAGQRPEASEYEVDAAATAIDAVREGARRSIRSVVLRWRRRERRVAAIGRRRAALLDVLPQADGLLVADLTYRRAVELGEQLQQCAALTVAGRHAIKLECGE